jgi:cullin 3
LLLANIALDRQGQPIDTIEMKHMLDMLVELGVRTVDVYAADFEGDFLDQTQSFYQQESQECISNNTCPEYMKKAETRLREEHTRSSLYLHTSTEPKLSGIVETELIKNHAETLINMENSGAVSMFRDDKVEDLKRMYQLFDRVPATLTLLRESMGEYVKHTGSNLVRDQEKQKKPVEFVEKLLKLRDKYDVIVSKSMNGDKSFSKILKEAFESFINTDARVANYLAQYIDDMLRKGLFPL